MLAILLNILVAVLVFWLILTLVKMIADPKIRQIVTIIVIVLALIWLLQVFFNPGPVLYFGPSPHSLFR